MSWTVSAVPFEAVEDMWPTVLPMLQDAIDMSDGRIDAATVLDSLRARTFVLWVVYPPDLSICAAMVTSVMQYPLKSVLSVRLMGGHGMQHWLASVVQVLRNFAHDSGLPGVEMTGREGWLRPLTRLGWSPLSVVCSIDAIAVSEADGV